MEVPKDIAKTDNIIRFNQKTVSKLNIIRDLILKGKLKHDIKDYCFNEISELSNTITKNSERV